MNKQKQENHSFVLDIKSQENFTWQGTITWIEGKQKKSFRSALEMLKLIESSLEN